jgi:hypothetical protein
MKKIKELWNRIFKRWTPWVIVGENCCYIKITESAPIFGSYPIERKTILVDIYKKTNIYTGEIKTKYVEKKRK